MFKKLALIAAAAALLGGIAPALAQTTTTLSVTASVAENCAIATTPVAFGAYDPVSANAAAGVDRTGTGTVVVTCTKNAAGVNITLGLGANTAGGLRRMLGGGIGEFLTYELYHPSATTPAAVCAPLTTVWGTAGGAIFTPTGTANWGANSPKTFNVCGSVTKGQDIAVDSYTDSVVATVNF
jgi:spore coat protein U-like protein